jgi:hypothetical protein
LFDVVEKKTPLVVVLISSYVCMDGEREREGGRWDEISLHIRKKEKKTTSCDKEHLLSPIIDDTQCEQGK